MYIRCLARSRWDHQVDGIFSKSRPTGHTCPNIYVG